MATRKPAPAPYVALRHVALPDRAVTPGETVELESDVAGDLVRDGMVRPAGKGE